MKQLGAFLWDFVVGDDWTVAAAVVFGLLATAFLNARAVAAWWLVPVLVVVMVVVSLRRASPHRNFLREAQEEKK